MGGGGGAPSFADMVEQMEESLAEAGADPRSLSGMTFFDFERIMTGWKGRVTRRREELAWYTLCLMRTQTKKITFKDIMAPFKERKSSEELLRERAEIYREFGLDPEGHPLERR